ncbi:hypothetical protein [Halegenticoccus tardaugens]|uniref:hypothetical protein n=1 Tax=Halegenticoccus tardaugens TaxID=2071624 RepID=UPI00100BE772|nr:hypothetical protein [Halegenticoccus tardaugens]
MRRRVILAAVTAGLAGCSTRLFDDPSADGSTPGTADASTDAPGAVALPYRSDDPDDNLDRPRGIEVQNATDRDQYATVAVETEDGRTVLYENESVEAHGATSYADLAAKISVYPTVFETEEGARTAFDWVVGPTASKLFVGITDDRIYTEQHVLCDPAARPIRASGEAVDLPFEGEGGKEAGDGGSGGEADGGERRDGADRTDGPLDADSAFGYVDETQRYTTAGVVLQNPSEERRNVRVAAADGGRTLVDYRYEVPAGVGLSVPIARTEATLDLTVDCDGERTYEWHVPEERVLDFDATAAAEPRCRATAGTGRFRLDRIANEDERGHRLSLSVDADGERALDESFEVGPREEAFPTASVGRAGRYRVVAELDAGERVTGDWSICTPPSPLSVRIAPNGALVLGSGTARVASRTPDAPTTATWSSPGNETSDAPNASSASNSTSDGSDPTTATETASSE